MDPTNPVVALCAQGMEAEARHRFDEARALFERAWEARRTDYDAAIAAHFLARHQPGPEEGLLWNLRALEHASAAPPREVETFLASLHLNLAHSYEMLARPGEALRHLALGEAHLPALPNAPYASVVRDGLERMRRRLAGPGSG